MFIKKISVYFCPLILFLGLELMFYRINLTSIIIILLTLIVITLIFIKFLVKSRFLSREYLYLTLSPVLFLISSAGFLFLLSSDNLRHLSMLVFAFILGMYLENIFLFFYQPIHYQQGSLENFSSFLSLLVFFLAVIDLNSLNIFLNLPIWSVSLLLIFFITLLLQQAYWINKIQYKSKIIYLFIINIIMLELFWGISFLPTNFYISSIVLTIAFYFCWGLVKAKLEGSLGKKIFLQYLAISSALLLLIIISSNWI